LHDLLYYSGVDYVITRLNLAAPLFFAREEGGTDEGNTIDPFGYGADTGTGRLLCFEVKDPLSFECKAEHFLGALEAWGTELPAAALLPEGAKLLVLPPGDYLFAQERNFLRPGEITAMAVDIQQEALWQRLKPGGRLFLRYLFEDGRKVTQVFRPVAETACG
jgi:hypothetical protein